MFSHIVKEVKLISYHLRWLCRRKKMASFKKFARKLVNPLRKSVSLSKLNLDATESKQEFGLDFKDVKIALGNGVEMKLDLQKGQWTSG